MKRRFKTTASLFLLLVFLLPTVVKLEHNHEHFVCKAENENHYHSHHERCIICSFEFSAFLSGFDKTELLKENPTDNYSNSYNSLYYFNLSLISFSLRGPPAIQI
jgi:hypothetical protein